VRERPSERVYLDARRHGIVLLPGLLRACGVEGAGGFLIAAPFPLPLVGAVLIVVAALLALRAVWQWEQTHVLVTDEKLALVRGTLRRRTAAVSLERVGGVEVDQTLFGRLFGYGTVTAGPLAITYVPQPRNVYGLVDSLSP
jgi:membrane protein YdbS with pleckstrin-like domain